MRVSFLFFAVIFATTPPLAKPARCFTTDDGYFPCDFKSLDRAGSFTISAERWARNYEDRNSVDHDVALPGIRV